MQQVTIQIGTLFEDDDGFDREASKAKFRQMLIAAIKSDFPGVTVKVQFPEDDLGNRVLVAPKDEPRRLSIAVLVDRLWMIDFCKWAVR